LAGTASPPEARVALDKALSIFRETSYHYRLSELFFRRGVVERSLGLGEAAERDFAFALREAERQRERIEALQERISFFDRIRETLDAMIALQVARDRPLEALRYSEQAKARVLGDWIVTQAVERPGPLPRPLPAPSPREIASLLGNLPPETVVLHFAVLPQTTVLWLLRQGKEPKAVTLPIGDKDLADRVTALHKGSDRAFQSLSANLYDTLILPVEHDLRSGDRLVLVPDQALHRLSFATLWNRRTGRYLIQDHVLSVAPSLRVFAAGVRREAVLRRALNVRALVVSNPKFDLTLYGWLTRLSAEAAAITDGAVTKNFPGSMVIQGEEATPRVFLRAAGDFGILHFGGHSVINSDLPLLSQMLFANEPGDPARGVLYSRDILRRRFPRTRLAVLASCGTAQGRITRTEGVESLARPFLAAGIPAVVASLWSVGDESTAEFFAQFYTHLRSEFDAAAALRSTQVEAIERGGSKSENPETWGAFEVIGSSVADPSRGKGLGLASKNHN
jgi:CHAT domain-containing protein